MTDERHWQSPVLQSVLPVIEGSAHVATSNEAVDRVAAWMAYEEFAWPEAGVAGEFSFADAVIATDAVMFSNLLNFAFTDFDSGTKFEATYRGRVWSDSEAMFARIHEAVEKGVPLFDGAFLAEIDRDTLNRLFAGNIEIPMLDERVEILRQAGRTLVDHHGGSLHHFVMSGPPRMYGAGDGLIDRMVTEFPRFDDTTVVGGLEVRFHKLAQLALWNLHTRSPDGWFLEDIEMMTAFADYILPVALRLLGILEWSEDLVNRVAAGVEIPRDSIEEVELRAHTIYATALLTDAINAIRPSNLGLIIPQVDFRLWKAYHATFVPHHLTRTIMY
ncbi:MAG: queuosine salvage family protein [Acidimicrobiia bacterium]|nr:queuosine salvage family protein [Acidimicrobiia bacterium]MDH4308674.1 queuosine salvage family protein [Acidimicrobiia bacterium]